MAWLYKQPGSDNWWLGYRLNGKQVRRSLKTGDEAQANRELAKLDMIAKAHQVGSLTDEFIRAITRKVGSGDTLHSYVNQFLKECKDLSVRTSERYQDMLGEFCDYVNADEAAPLLRDIQPATVAAYLREKRANTSMSTAKLARVILSSFFNYCVDNEALQVNPVPRAKALKLTGNSTAVRRAFTLAELKTIFEKAPTPFWKYMVLAGFYLGQRMGDLICLPWGAVDFESRLIRLTASKTGKTLKIPLRVELGTLLQGLKRRAGDVKPGMPIWPDECKQYEEQGAGNFSNQFYEDILLPAGLVPKRTHHAKKKAGDRTRRRQTNEISFHCLRHTFVTLLKVSGSTQATVKELAGHSSDEISDLYTHAPEAELTKAIKQLPGVTK